MALTSFKEWRLRLEATLPTGKEINPRNNPVVPYTTVDEALEAAIERRATLRAILEGALREAGNKGYIDDVHGLKLKNRIEEKIEQKQAEGRKNYSVKDMTDILRASLIMDTKEDAEVAAEELYRKAKWFAFEYKDKPKPGDRLGYFGTYHIDLNIDEMPVEVQVLTSKVAPIKKVAHPQFAIARTGGEIDPSQAIIAARGFKRKAEEKPAREQSGKRPPRREREKRIPMNDD